MNATADTRTHALGECAFVNPVAQCGASLKATACGPFHVPISVFLAEYRSPATGRDLCPECWRALIPAGWTFADA